MSNRNTIHEAVDYIANERIDNVLKRWAKQSGEQLRDSYKMQRIYPVGEVWPGWFEQNRKNARSTRNGAWVSTGHSYEVADDVQTSGYWLDEVEIKWHTTLGALYAEAGAGLTGNKYTRGRRSRRGRKRIKIQRKDNYSHSRRYVDEWVPMAGRTHRPATRQQINLFRRRLEWLAKRTYLYNAATWLAYEIESALSEIKPTTPFGEVVFKPTRKLQAANLDAWAAALAKQSGD